MTHGTQSGTLARVVRRFVVAAVASVEGFSGLSLFDGLDGRPLVTA